VRNQEVSFLVITCITKFDFLEKHGNVEKIVMSSGFKEFSEFALHFHGRTVDETQIWKQSLLRGFENFLDASGGIDGINFSKGVVECKSWTS